MSTSLEERIQRSPLADEHNLDSAALDQQRLQLLHTGLVHHRRPVRGHLQKGGVVDADPPPERQVAAEKAPKADRAVTGHRQQPAEGPATGLARKPRGPEEAGGYDVG